MDYLVRIASIDDLSELQVMIRNSFSMATHSDGNEHNLVANLFKSKSYIPELSLVSTFNKEICGYCLCTELNNGESGYIALAPLAVSVEHQQKGIGSTLVNNTLKKAKELGYKAIFILGDPNYYKKFGFEDSTRFGITAPFDVPSEYYLVKELEKNCLTNYTGEINYAPEFLN